MAEQKEKAKTQILKSALEGKMRLEFYPEKKSHIVSFKGNKEIFWVEYQTLKEIMEDFDLLFQVRNKKPVAIYTSTTIKNKSSKKKDEKPKK